MMNYLNFNYLQSIIISIFVLCIFNACSRETGTKSTVTVSMPSARKVTAAGVCDTIKCLKEFVINVEGEGFQKIVEHRKVNFDNDDVLGGEIVMEVPSGKARNFKIVAVFKKGDDVLTQYGQKLSDVFGDQAADVNVPLGNESTFLRARIAGRYLTSANEGPTGKVTLSISPPNSDFSIEFGEQSMLKGWFNFEFSKNYLFTAKLADGTTLFDKATSESIMPVTSTGSNVLSRLHFKQDSYWRYMQPSWTEETDADDIIFGFFSNGVDISSKFVCLEHAGASPVVINASSLALTASGTPPATYHHASTSADIYAIGGVTSSTFAGCTSPTTGTRFTDDSIRIAKSQILVNGRDETTGMLGAFSIVASGTQTMRYLTETPTSAAPPIITLTPLPGMYDGAAPLFNSSGGAGRLFTKANSIDNNSQRIQCNTSWMTNNGYTEITSSLSDPASYDNSKGTVSFRYSSTSGTHQTNMKSNVIFCPTSAGNMQQDGLGGINIAGSLFAYIGTNTPPSIASLNEFYLNIRNHGTASTQINVNIPDTTRMDYKGGSFPGLLPHPGTACSTNPMVLGPADECSIRIYHHTSGGTVNHNILIQYHDGRSSQTLTVPVNLTSA